ncbi:MAG TPA: hypothetical protein VFW85_08270 [Gaiellaceae bacterium]|nr:hypothetical protein [Gaiellaceae bacterium]
MSSSVLTPETTLDATVGYLVADRAGRLVGKVECPMYGRSADTPDALAVKPRVMTHRRLLVPATSIAEVDRRSRVVGLKVDRRAIRSFL